MNILLLGPLNQKTHKGKRIEPLIRFLKSKKHKIFTCNKSISYNFIKKNNIQMVVSSGYAFKIDTKIIKYLKNKIINLHPSYLPYGKGIGGLMFSIIKGLPTGISIHLIEEKIDAGRIIKQKIINPKLNENYRTFYLTLLDELNDLFIREFDNILSKKNKLIKQKIPLNPDFYTRERSEIIYEFFEKTYDINIKDLVSFSNKFAENEDFFELMN